MNVDVNVDVLVVVAVDARCERICKKTEHIYAHGIFPVKLKPRRLSDGPPGLTSESRWKHHQLAVGSMK